MSVTDLTTQAAWMAGLAIAALLFAGWRKNARPIAPIPRSEVPRRELPHSELPHSELPRSEPAVRRPLAPFGVAETTATLDKRTGMLRRVWAVVASSTLAVVIGVVTATVVAFGMVWAVTTLTDLLKQ